MPGSPIWNFLRSSALSFAETRRPLRGSMNVPVKLAWPLSLLFGLRLQGMGRFVLLHVDYIYFVCFCAGGFPGTACFTFSARSVPDGNRVSPRKVLRQTWNRVDYVRQHFIEADAPPGLHVQKHLHLVQD